MDVRKEYLSFYVHIDEIVEGVDFNENRLLIRPLVTKMLERYQTDYTNSIEFEKEHKKKGNRKLALWQAKRQVALAQITELLLGILDNLEGLNKPLKDYHNDCMGAYNEVKT